MDKGRQPGGGETNNSTSISRHVGGGMQEAISPLRLTFLRALARGDFLSSKESPGQKRSTQERSTQKRSTQKERFFVQ
jgi:hypothetical protein